MSGDEDDQHVPQALGAQVVQASQPEKVWKLDGCQMEILSHRKIGKQQHMTLELKFTFLNDPFPKYVDLPFKPDIIKNAQFFCNSALEDFLFLEDCSTSQQAKYFTVFLEQEIRKYKENQMDQDGMRDPRPKVEFGEPTVKRIGSKLYLIASDVFDLSNGAKCLSNDDLKSFPDRYVYSGLEFRFKTEEAEAFQIFFSIVAKMNSMQDPDFYSFALATFVAHLAGELYLQVIEEQGNFSIQMSVSGDATGTGKSLMQSVWMRAFKNEEQATVTSVTQAQAHEVLGSGRNIYAKEFCKKKQPGRCAAIDASFLTFVIPVLWERSGKMSKGKEIRPNAVVHLDGNIVPEDVAEHLGPAMMSKMKFNFTGKTPLQHPEEILVIDDMLEAALKLYEYLPVVLSWGVDAVLPKVTPTEVAGLDDVLLKKKDRREGQLIRNYDRMFRKCREAIIKYKLEAPPLFLCDVIDRTSMIYFNSNTEEKIQKQQATKDLASSIEKLGLGRILEQTSRGRFKIPATELGLFPKCLAKSLKGFKSSSSTFKGKAGKRVIIFHESDMSQSTVKKMKLLATAKYILWIKGAKKMEAEKEYNYGDYLYSRADGRSAVIESGVNHLVDVRDEVLIPELQAGSSKDLEDFRCSRLGCKKFGETFLTASELEKHEGLQYHKKSKAKSLKPIM